MYGSTEELFFVDWDMGGPYWKSDQLKQRYEKFSPHQAVRNWETPLLVIHGQKDFRVPVTQAMEAFTAAQVNKVPSRFLYFPEEGHWVQTPQNGVLWHRVFFDWLKKYCPPHEESLPKTLTLPTPAVE
jgi:dipeptidyl aminopeptidase/acylaminoacyl peptidase